MAYTPREIKDRVAVGDDIFIVENLGNNRMRLIPAPTHVSEAGTPVNKALLQHMENHLFPPGGIIMWSGAINDIPVGWALCDGSNGTPNLRDRFVVGAGGSYGVGNTGGSSSVTLSVSEIPSHRHSSGTLYTDMKGEHAHVLEYTASLGEHRHTDRSLSSGYHYWSDTNYQDLPTGKSGDHMHNVHGDTSYAGGGQSHENRPPYYALAYIMKL